MGQADEAQKLSWLNGLPFIEGIIAKFIEGIPGITTKINDSLSTFYHSGPFKNWDDAVNEWVTKGFCDKDTGDILKKLKEDSFPGGFIVTLYMRIQMISILMSSVANVMGLDRQYALLAQTTPNPAPIENLVRSMIIDPSRASENRAKMKQYGYDNTQIDNIILSFYNMVDLETIRLNYLRGNYDDSKLYERMRELGYTDTRTKEIVQTWIFYPSPQDLFTMVAREAFEPDQYVKMGLDSEFPAEQVKWLEAQGISQEWAMKYWISHWNEPSIEQAYEMYHRGVIGKEEVELLFKVVEIPPFWRDKLLAIAFNPYTRVDTRRMHQLGVLNDEEVVKAYQDQGYDGDHAVKMAEFTIRENAESQNELNKGTILSAYGDNLINRSSAKEMLIAHHMSDDAAEFFLTNEEYKRDLETVNLYIKILEEKFITNMISESEAKSELLKLNLLATKVDALLEKWSIQKYKYEKKPSKSELDDLLIEGIITETQWTDGMSLLGYSFKYQEWFRALIDRYVSISAKLPTKAELIAWVHKDIIDVPTFRIEMKQLGYGDRYIDFYIKAMS